MALCICTYSPPLPVLKYYKKTQFGSLKVGVHICCFLTFLLMVLMQKSNANFSYRSIGYIGNKI